MWMSLLLLLFYYIFLLLLLYYCFSYLFIVFIMSSCPRAAVIKHISILMDWWRICDLINIYMIWTLTHSMLDISKYNNVNIITEHCVLLSVSGVSTEDDEEEDEEDDEEEEEEEEGEQRIFRPVSVSLVKDTFISSMHRECSGIFPHAAARPAVVCSWMSPLIRLAHMSAVTVKSRTDYRRPWHSPVSPERSRFSRFSRLSRCCRCCRGRGSESRCRSSVTSRRTLPLNVARCREASEHPESVRTESKDANTVTMVTAVQLLGLLWLL